MAWAESKGWKETEKQVSAYEAKPLTSGVSQKFCKLFWHFKILITRHNFYENPNIEIRNPKQYLNPNVQNSKQNRPNNKCDWAFWSFVFGLLWFALRLCSGWWVLRLCSGPWACRTAGRTISSFEFRISCFPVPLRWVNRMTSRTILYCHFRMHN